MKKISVVIYLYGFLLMLFLMLTVLETRDIYKTIEKRTNVVWTEDIGYGYDFSYQAPFSNKYKRATIFDDNWLRNESSIIRSEPNPSEYYSSNDFSYLMKQIDDSWSKKIGIDDIRISNTGTMLNHHSLAKNKKQDEFSSAVHFYYRGTKNASRYHSKELVSKNGTKLNDTFLNEIAIIDELQKKYESNKTDIIVKNTIRYSLNAKLISLIKTYGTHVITSIEYGAVLEGFKSIYFTMQNVSPEIRIRLARDLNNAYNRLLNDGNNQTLNTTINELSKKYVFNGTDVTRVFADSKQFVSNSKTWSFSTYNGINNAITQTANTAKEKMIDSAKPIEEYIENEYTHASVAIKNFIEYYNSKEYIKYEIPLGNSIDIKLPTEGEVNEINISGKRVVTHDGLFKNPTVQIDMSDLFKNASHLDKAGFKNIQIAMTYSVKNINLGYRYIYMFSTQNDTNEDNALIGKKFDDKASSNDLQMSTKVSIYSLKSSALYLRFNASGSMGDTWEISNIKFKITFLR